MSGVVFRGSSSFTGLSSFGDCRQRLWYYCYCAMSCRQNLYFLLVFCLSISPLPSPSVSHYLHLLSIFLLHFKTFISLSLFFLKMLYHQPRSSTCFLHISLLVSMYNWYLSFSLFMATFVFVLNWHCVLSSHHHQNRRQQ